MPVVDVKDGSVVPERTAEGMERSKVVETFDYLVTTIGPRLTNSPAHKRAIAWIEKDLAPLLAGHASAAAGPVIVHTLA